MQTEVLFLVHLLGFDDPAYKALNLRNKPDEDESVHHIEGGVEGGQHKRQFSGVGDKGFSAYDALLHRHIIANPSTNHIDERTEYKEHPQHTEEVEEHMGECSAAGLRVGREGCQVGRNGSADILTHHQCNTLVNGQGTAGAENHRDGHDSSRGLHTESEDAAQKQEDKRSGKGLGIERGEEIQHRLILAQVHFRACHAKRSQSQKQERDTKEEVADIAIALLINKDDTYQEGWIHSAGDIEGHTCRHNPCREGRTDIGTHNDRDGLRQREQTGIHKRHGHHCGGGGRLHGGCDECTRQHPRETVSGHRAKDMTQLWTRHLLQRLTHGLHTEHEKRKGAQEL